jgi:hypothetical protein
MLPGTGGSCINPSYSGGRDQEDHSSRPAWGKSETLSQKCKHTHTEIEKEKEGGLAKSLNGGAPA